MKQEWDGQEGGGAGARALKQKLAAKISKTFRTDFHSVTLAGLQSEGDYVSGIFSLAASNWISSSSCAVHFALHFAFSGLGLASVLFCNAFVFFF